jgi:Reverse transcriptase (RNA-dependent DNA polymerase)
MGDALKEKCELNDIDLIPQFHAWCLAVEKLDIAVRWEKMTALAAANELNRASGKHITNGNMRSTPTSTPSAAGGGSLAHRGLPKLTQGEKDLLNANSSCYKCRRFHVGHRADSCPNGFPSAADYKMLTQVDLDAATAVKQKRVGHTVSHIRVDAISDGTVDCIARQTGVLGIGQEDSEYVLSPFHGPLLEWPAVINRCGTSHIPVNTLINNGSYIVLIDEALATQLSLPCFPFQQTETARLAMGNGEVLLKDWVKLSLSSVDLSWDSCILRAIVAPSLAYPVLLGTPFLSCNKILIDHDKRIVTAQEDNYQLLVSKQIHPHLSHPIASVKATLQYLSRADILLQHEKQLKAKFSDCFPTDIPPVHEMPSNVYHRFKLKNPTKLVKCCAYACPRKYREAWHTLLDQHLAAGRIRESSSSYASPAFIIPKADPTVLPRWVNDYRQLNVNTVPDHYPLPRVDSILSDCAKGKIWSKLDMTNSFLQTLVHPDDIHLTAVLTPFGLYEWLVMPMGCRNAPATHQRRMNLALQHLIGRICHVYLDDIVIWSQSLSEHVINVCHIFQALRDAHLYCSNKKMTLFTDELDFLGHVISARGIEVDPKKVEKIINWPTPVCAKGVCSFLGLVRYLALFLPNLAEYTCVLTPLTGKEMDKDWPRWTRLH